ncbi:hypothetical protein [Marinospirillum minutulum]|uniref:hypothetical protein n=1 Tax=Marinospirillum minutulum TaxID=64974 RepID=UPI000429A96B|nr:hypothetical protein [Marinospirillum minutulum]
MQEEAPEQASELIKSTVKMQGEGNNTLAIGLVDRNNDVAWANLNEVVRYFIYLSRQREVFGALVGGYEVLFEELQAVALAS